MRRRDRMRGMIAREAARLMLEEDVGQYLDAKQIAAHRVLGRGAAQAALPSNGEIKAAVLRMVDGREGPDRRGLLRSMRAEAVRVLDALEPFHPRLIGSVATGHAHEGSDIDVHVFTDDPGAVERHLWLLGWDWEPRKALVQSGGEVREYLHLLVEAAYPVELSVYGLAERRMRPRSSTDGKPIDRVSVGRLRAMLRDG